MILIIILIFILELDNISDLFSDKTFSNDVLDTFYYQLIFLQVVGLLKTLKNFQINKILLFFPLIITYLIGPLGLFIYWLIRIFYAKSINLYD